MSQGSAPAGHGRWEIAPLGDTGLLVTWQGRQDSASAAVRQLLDALETQRPAGVVELVPGIASLLVCYDPLTVAPGPLRGRLEALLPHAVVPRPAGGRIVEVAVTYGGADGPDLPYVARASGLSEVEVVAHHTAQPMPVLMIGFMPGFPYIGELPPRLHLPRRAEPRTAVAAGSVAIANDQTGIYPSQSPGGWHVIGRTDVQLFDPLREPPALLRAGDYVQFVAQPRG